MALKIVWSELADKTFESNMKYLEENWEDKVIRKFLQRVNKKLDLLAHQPEIGVLINKRTQLRKTLVHPKVILLYRIKPKLNQLQLVQFFNTWQNPARLRKS